MQTLLFGRPWSRREWLATNAMMFTPRAVAGFGDTYPGIVSRVTGDVSRVGAQNMPLEPNRAEMLARRAIEAATAAGASFATARLTRTVYHLYDFGNNEIPASLAQAFEFVGIGVQALVDGCWGFSTSPYWDIDDVTRLGRGAAAQGAANAKFADRSLRVELGRVPVGTGTWVTPVEIDPFSVTIEEKVDTIEWWKHIADRLGAYVQGISSYYRCVRQERVLATSEGTLVRQTVFETGANVVIGKVFPDIGGSGIELPLPGLDAAGKGWELIRDANIPAGIATMAETTLHAEGMARATARPSTVGQYTIVCDGATMAAITDQTLGLATQLDRALGYEANSRGTSYLDDPLGMLGQFAVSTPAVTITADRTIPGQLATVKWDDEGVVPGQCTLVKDGVLTNYQTTREQAAWLAPYYQKHGIPAVSSGFAASESALMPTIQHTPNLSLLPTDRGAQIDDLVATVPRGIFIGGGVARADFQLRTGLLYGTTMRRIENGRLGPRIRGGAILFNTANFWKNVTTVGGASTVLATPISQFDGRLSMWGGHDPALLKGEPPQMSSHTVSAAAAVVTQQSLIDPNKRS